MDARFEELDKRVKKLEEKDNQQTTVGTKKVSCLDKIIQHHSFDKFECYYGLYEEGTWTVYIHCLNGKYIADVMAFTLDEAFEEAAKVACKHFKL
jgi:hypothetical protein